MVQALELENEKTEQGRSIQCTPYEEDSLKDMYQRRIQVDHNPEIETEWECMKGIVQNLAREVLGAKKISDLKHGLRHGTLNYKHQRKRKRKST